MRRGCLQPVTVSSLRRLGWELGGQDKSGSAQRVPERSQTFTGGKFWRTPFGDRRVSH